jgi:hypothetical protein
VKKISARTRRKLKDYIRKGVRKIKHRKGYGVHSPFAYAVITEVIEERNAYYAYQRMRRLYPKGGVLPFKVACLLFRLANRFRVRTVLEIGCDGGYSLLPLLLVDSHNQVTSVATACQRGETERHLTAFHGSLNRVGFAESLPSLPDDYVADMVVVNGLPDGMDPQIFLGWIQQHTHEQSLFFVRGIQPGHQLEQFWDGVCECDRIEVTMDLYDYGLAIRRPHFFKQHYVVSF